MHIRQFSRLPTSDSCHLAFQGMPGESRLTLKDISQGGFCFNALGYIKSGTRLAVDVPLLGKNISKIATVAWSKCTDKHRCQIGLSFD